MSLNLSIYAHPGCDNVTIMQRRDGEEWPFAAVYPGVTMSVPGTPEVQALARARAQRIIDALAAEAVELPTSGKSLDQVLRNATGLPDHWKASPEE